MPEPAQHCARAAPSMPSAVNRTVRMTEPVQGGGGQCHPPRIRPTVARTHMAWCTTVPTTPNQTIRLSDPSQYGARAAPAMPFAPNRSVCPPELARPSARAVPTAPNRIVRTLEPAGTMSWQPRRAIHPESYCLPPDRTRQGVWAVPAASNQTVRLPDPANHGVRAAPAMPSASNQSVHPLKPEGMMHWKSRLPQTGPSVRPNSHGKVRGQPRPCHPP